QTSFLEECVQFPCQSCGLKSRQNASLGTECLRGAPAMVAAGWGRHSDDSKGRCEIRPDSPSASDPDWLQPPAARRPGESECCPDARIPVPAVRAAAWAVAPREYHPPRP